MNWQAKNTNFNLLIRQVFHDNESDKRAEAARQLGFLQDGRAVNLLCRALKSEDNPVVINRLIEALGRIADGRATLSIINKLEEEIKKPKLEMDKLRVIFIIESLIRIKDKRALKSLSYFLNSSDDKLLHLTESAFDAIQPNWRQIIERERKEKSIQDIFKHSM
ncbi:MAG: HEAT repeat domain-containing protein [Candidatus Lokiarchaeota archaeon]|nr:HEAT repeat domain-containing protein [Candidatus Lokiarchaeota archaeon]